MPLNENDLSYFIDIVDCIIDINEFTRSVEYYQFEKDKMRKLAVERQLEVIGQAANKISIETQNSLKNIPWKILLDYGTNWRMIMGKYWLKGYGKYQNIHYRNY